MEPRDLSGNGRSPEGDEFSFARRRMVEEQLEGRGIRDPEWGKPVLVRE